MARSGSGVGTVVRWDAEQGTGVIELPERGGECRVDAGALDPGTRGTLRAGQIVHVEWVEADDHVRAERVTLGDDLQATPGG